MYSNYVKSKLVNLYLIKNNEYIIQYQFNKLCYAHNQLKT